MSIAWQSFTPGSALAGGVLIGVGAALLMATLGRIAGVSGILGALVPPAAGSAWRVAFLGGLVLAPWIYGLFAEQAAPRFISSTPWLILAGLLVGFGTRLGSGCTTGHGVCGLARGAPRSVAAVLVFMLTAMAVVAIVRYLAGN
ncbi:YeeE/YedE family protein [Bordetella genomosp. 12]|uniref:YeeE/YedE n=1 Tax=Bordetella genomosp. 12 TaxID=463035 RepID=A0A261VDK6_9BORD|nr:YeeE/YedE thiosulfate transporter family protein [Bordetella genomosp. 12]OZI72085.1 YeeE/YedE [Bordetella genomosp. 12]